MFGVPVLRIPFSRKQYNLHFSDASTLMPMLALSDPLLLYRLLILQRDNQCARARARAAYGLHAVRDFRGFVATLWLCDAAQ